MIKQEDRITIFKNLDREYYNLLNELEITDFGEVKFRGNNVDKIIMEGNRPKRVVTIRQSVMLRDIR